MSLCKVLIYSAIMDVLKVYKDTLGITPQKSWRTPQGAPWRTVGETHDSSTQLFGATNNTALSSTKASWVTTVNIGSGVSTKGGALSTATTKTLYLPATGWCNNSTGQVYNQGQSGYYWTSSQYSNTSGYYLDFFSSTVYPSGNTLYTTGAAVRCVR